MGEEDFRMLKLGRFMNRYQIAGLLLTRLEEVQDALRESFRRSRDGIGYFYVDELLPNEIAMQMYESFPDPSSMKLNRSLREYKYIAAQMDQYNPLLEEAIYAFQDLRIVSKVQEICGLEELVPDDNLYAGGISLMGHGQYLNPHLDNSHDKERNLWRVLNLLYYVTPDWDYDDGGNLEVWPKGLGSPQTTIHSKFNRLAVMATHQDSWHSVSPISSDKKRCCISNYYFSETPVRSTDQFHVTSFRGRPEQRIRDVVLKADNSLRMGLRKVFKKGVVENKHVYKK